MRVQTVALWALVGMLASSAAAMAIPLHSSDSPTISGDPQKPTSTDISHFTAGQTLTVDARLGHASIASSSPGETFLFASVAGTDASETSAPPLNLAIVIDRSGSMKGERLANAIAAAVGTVERMRDVDTVTVVSFDTEAQVVVPPTAASASARPSIESAIRSIRLGGDTCISCGLESAMSQLRTAPVASDHVTRMLLLSDGATNHGITDLGGLRALAGRMRDRGCAISTIGVDVDFDEKVMAALALESNGRHYFVQNPSELPAIFAQEFDSLLSSVARESELAVEVAPGVEVEQVFDRTFRREGSRVIVPFGTFSAKQEKTVLMKLRVPTDRDGVQPVASVKLNYRDLVQKSDGSCRGDLALLVTSDGSAQKELDPFVATRLERSRTAETLTEANQLFEQGRVNEARDKLARREEELKATGTTARAAAKTARPLAVGRGDAFDVDKDFDRQSAAVAQAESSFAAPPPAATPAAGAGAAPAPARIAPQDSRAGKAGVRANQANAVDLAF